MILNNLALVIKAFRVWARVDRLVSFRFNCGSELFYHFLSLALVVYSGIITLMVLRRLLITSLTMLLSFTDRLMLFRILLIFCPLRLETHR